MNFFFKFVIGVFLIVAHAEAGTYTVNAGDILTISVWNESALQQELRVLPDGSISFPLVGDLSVADKSISQIQAEIKTKLAKFITDPQVNVSVKETAGNLIYVIGQVKAPGKFIMYQPLDVMQALSLASGLTPYAKASGIKILRHHGDKSEAIAYEYGKVADGDKLETSYQLHSGDVVFVP